VAASAEFLSRRHDHVLAGIGVLVDPCSMPNHQRGLETCVKIKFYAAIWPLH